MTSDESNIMTPIGAIALVCALLVLGMFFFVGNAEERIECNEEFHLYNPPYAFNAGGLWGFSDNDIYVAGHPSSAVPESNSEIYHWDGNTLTSSFTIARSTFTGRQIWGYDNSHVWWVGGGTPFASYYYNGINWAGSNIVVSGVAGVFEDIHGSSNNNVWAVASGGGASTDVRVRYWDGIQWNKVTVAQIGNLARVFVFDINSVVITGAANGYVAYYNGILWTDISIPDETIGITGIWGTSINDFWVAATNKGYYHYVNGVWSHLYPLTTAFRMNGLDINNIYSVSGAKVASYNSQDDFWSILLDNTGNTAQGASIGYDRIWVDTITQNIYVSVRGTGTGVFTNGFSEISCQTIIIPTSFADYGRALVPVIIGVGITIYVFSLRHKED